MTRTEWLAKTVLFHGFSDAGRDMFAKAMNVHKVEPGQSVFEEGRPGGSLYFVGSGKLEVATTRNDGSVVTLCALTPPQSFGEVTFLTAGEHLCRVSAVETAQVLELTRDSFLTLQKEKPQTCLKLLHRIVVLFGEELRQNKAVFKAVV